MNNTEICSHILLLAARGRSTDRFKYYMHFYVQTPNLLYLRGGEIIKGTLNKNASNV